MRSGIRTTAISKYLKGHFEVVAQQKQKGSRFASGGQTTGSGLLKIAAVQKMVNGKTRVWLWWGLGGPGLTHTELGGPPNQKTSWWMIHFLVPGAVRMRGICGTCSLHFPSLLCGSLCQRDYFLTWPVTATPRCEDCSLVLIISWQPQKCYSQMLCRLSILTS